VVILATTTVLAVAGASAETFTLDLKRLEPLDLSEGVPPGEFVYRITRPQHFVAQTGTGQPLREFSDLSRMSPTSITRRFRSAP
jgi:hypothetical protein